MGYSQGSLLIVGWVPYFKPLYCQFFSNPLFSLGRKIRQPQREVSNNTRNNAAFAAGSDCTCMPFAHPCTSGSTTRVCTHHKAFIEIGQYNTRTCLLYSTYSSIGRRHLRNRNLAPAEYLTRQRGTLVTNSSKMTPEFILFAFTTAFIMLCSFAYLAPYTDANVLGAITWYY